MVSCHGYITQRSIVHSFVTVSPLRKQILSGLYGNPETLSVVGVGSTPQPRGGSTAPPLTRLYHRGRFFWKKIPKPPDVSFSMQGAVEGGWGRPITHLLVGGGSPPALPYGPVQQHRSPDVWSRVQTTYFVGGTGIPFPGRVPTAPAPRRSPPARRTSSDPSWRASGTRASPSPSARPPPPRLRPPPPRKQVAIVCQECFALGDVIGVNKWRLPPHSVANGAKG